jgi:hypothetical protein
MWHSYLEHPSGGKQQSTRRERAIADALDEPAGKRRRQPDGNREDRQL